MRILLVRPQQPEETHGLKLIMICEPLELEYVGASVPDHEVLICDLMVDNNLDACLKEFNPQVVGTSCYINNISEALDVCRRVKQYDPGIRTVMGGVHAALNPKDFQNRYVDFIVHGEGMTTFKELIECLDTGGDLSRVKGIGYGKKAGFCFTDVRPFPKDVDQFPLPDRKLTQPYRKDYFYLQWRPLTIMRTSWGCPYQCTFCYNRHLTDDKYFSRSPESVVNEIESIDSKEVFIIDDTFLFNKKRLDTLYHMIKERNIEKEYLVYGRTDFVVQNKEILRKWEDIGLRMLRVGIEAVTNEELDQYNKRNSIENNKKAVEICHELGIDVSASFILQPHYTKEHFKALNRYIKELGLVYIFLNPLTPLPATDLYHEYKDRLIVPYETGHALWDFQHCVIRPTQMSLKSFYRSMNIVYLSVLNPFRVRKIKMRKQPYLLPTSKETWGLYKNMFITMVDTLFAYRQHGIIENKNSHTRIKNKATEEVGHDLN
ncbi:MAG: B12-binding domain-containing radical SAM protein [Proteobacteria bacterium]|nr:B12-binding domain-containing radical SAM protein [Pseudomonadota bacterium]